MVRIPRLASDDSRHAKSSARPDLVDPQEREFVDDRVPPAPPAVPERVTQSRLEDAEHGIALRGVEVAPHDHGHRWRHGVEATGDDAKLLPTEPAVLPLFSPARGRPEVRPEDGGD